MILNIPTIELTVHSEDISILFTRLYLSTIYSNTSSMTITHRFGTKSPDSAHIRLPWQPTGQRHK